MAEDLQGYTRQCVVSFIDLYEKTKRNFPQARSVTAAQQEQLIETFSKIAAAKGMQIHLCCEDRALTRANVDADGCLSQTVLERAIGSALHVPEKKMARDACSCLLGADIGMYNTCGHGCLYCYANYDNESVRVNRKLHDPASPLLIGHLHETDIIKEAEQKRGRMDSLVFFKWDFKKLIQKGMVMIMTKQEKIERFRKMNETIEKGQIVCAGSSLMEMFPVEKFVQEDKLDLVIYNRGIGGFVTQELLDNIDVCILDLEPRRLFINIGTNDLSDPAISIEDMITNYDKILTIVQDKLPDIDIYMMAYYPINYDAATEEMKPCLLIRTNDKIAQANEAVRTLAKAHHAHYIDINAPLKDEQGNLKAEYTIEGMHIKEQGYRAIFDSFIKYALED